MTELTETQINNFYKRIHAQIGEQHNTILTRRKKYRCKECQNDTIVVDQPNDSKTRIGDHRVICILCQITWVVKSGEILHEQNLSEFVKENILRFKLV